MRRLAACGAIAKNASATLTLKAEAKRSLQKLAVGLSLRADTGQGLNRPGRRDGRPPDVVIPEFGENGAEVHARAHVHAEVRRTAFTDDILDWNQRTRIADVPPRIAESRHVAHSGRRHFDRP